MFTGRSTSNPGVFAGIAEDVSDVIGMISPAETPLLDALGDPDRPAHNVLHEWLEDEMKSNVTGEYLQVTGLNGNTMTFIRGFGGTTAGAITSGDSFFVISDAALEGADVTTDISRARARLSNYTQIFKKDVIVSGTQQA